MWINKENKLYKKFVFNDFVEAFSFMTKVGVEAEKMNHHPYWINVWNVVEIYLSTYDAGNIITEKDYSLAKKIDEIINN